jgi:hypothetical protein
MTRTFCVQLLADAASAHASRQRDEGELFEGKQLRMARSREVVRSGALRL